MLKNLLVFYVTFILSNVFNVTYSQTILGKISIPDGHLPTCTFYESHSQKLYTANLWNANMSVIDVTNHKIDTTVQMQGAYIGCLFVGVDKDNNRIYLSDIAGNMVVLSGNDYSLITSFTGVPGCGFARDSIQDKNYISVSSNEIIVINGTTSTIIDTIIIGEISSSFINTNNLCFDKENNLLYASCNNEKKIDVIDCGPDTIITHIPIISDTSPRSIDINYTTDRIYVTCDSSISVINSTNQQIITTIHLNCHPLDLCIDEPSNKIYISIENTNIIVIDGNTNTVEDTINYSTDFIDFAPSLNEIFLTLADESIINFISTPGYSLLKTLILFYRLDDIVIDELRNLLFVAITTKTNNNYIFKIDCDTDSIMDSLLINNESPYSLYLTYDDTLQKLYLAERSPKKLFCVNSETMSLISTHDLPDNPMHLNANPITGKVYIPMLNTSQLLVFDGIGDSIETFVNINSAPIDAEVNPFTNKIFISTESYYLDVVDGSTNQLDTSIYLTSGPFLESNCVNNLTNEIYVTSFSGQDVTILDGNNNYSVISTINFGHVMRDGVVNETTNRIFVHDADNNIYVINGNSHSVEDTIVIYKQETRLAVNTINGKLYVLDFGGILILKDDAAGIEEEVNIQNPICINFSLKSNIDNSFSIYYQLESPSFVEINIYDISGRCIRTLSSGLKSQGNHIVRWNSTDDNNIKLSNGIYFIHFSTGNNVNIIRKAVLIQ